jgi:hypothetical protein
MQLLRTLALLLPGGLPGLGCQCSFRAALRRSACAVGYPTAVGGCGSATVRARAMLSSVKFFADASNLPPSPNGAGEQGGRCP